MPPTATPPPGFLETNGKFFVAVHTNLALTLLMGHLMWQRISSRYGYCHTNMPLVLPEGMIACPTRIRMA